RRGVLRISIGALVICTFIQRKLEMAVKRQSFGVNRGPKSSTLAAHFALPQMKSLRRNEPSTMFSTGNSLADPIVFPDMRICRSPFSQFRPSPKTYIFIVVSLVCLFVANGLGQEPIRVNVRLVNVAFSARDSRGALVENLTKDQVEVFEDAVPQKISFFARSVALPLTLALLFAFPVSPYQLSHPHQR